ncbi:flagellar basal body protein [Citricoccus sp. K5]|uniref:flagellar basal body rod protein FlgB n=1 Tax=Citricoccus sp. K5 TaxID=2653135 RepID=UPI001359AB8D|nr:flagellar basal body protein [Citricoccus sp. K5]
MSVTVNALESALDGLAARQRAIANNLANVNTPQFQATRVQFEQQLARSIAAGDGRVTAAEQPSLEPTRLNGNNVNADTEVLSNEATVLSYQFASQAIKSKLSGVSTAARTS